MTKLTKTCGGRCFLIAKAAQTNKGGKGQSVSRAVNGVVCEGKDEEEWCGGKGNCRKEFARLIFFRQAARGESGEHCVLPFSVLPTPGELAIGPQTWAKLEGGQKKRIWFYTAPKGMWG